MSAEGRRLLILASAGTGKTYRLTSRFVELLEDGVDPARVLATTFTRKAAGEILDRVLGRLVDGAEADTGRRALLVRTVRVLDRFQVQTLDAFFVRVAKLFALDVGLPPDWSIVDDSEDEVLRREAIARALADAGGDEMLSLLRELQKAAAERSIETRLLSVVASGRNAWLDAAPGAWERVRPPRGLDDEERARALEGLEGMRLAVTKAGKPRSRWRSARDAMLGSARDGDWPGFLRSTLVQRALAGDPYDGSPVDEDQRAVLQPLLRQAAHELLSELSRQNDAVRKWLERFERAYAEVKAEERACRFEDLPKALLPTGAGDPLAERDLSLWYRMGEEVRHLLLDEFQDTAPAQWRILAPIAERILGDEGGRSFFCVGDVKQSIYAWREAEPRLLSETLRKDERLAQERLDVSWRSSEVILDTVHRVFGEIRGNRVLEDVEDAPEAAREWAETYVRVRPSETMVGVPGAAVLLEADEPPEGVPGSRPVLDLAAARVEAILSETPRATVGILFRRNDDVPRTIGLLARRGIRASDEGGNPLTDSRAVLEVLSLLHLADHPGDTAAAFHVATSRLGPCVGFTREGFVEQALEVAAVTRKRLAEEGYGAFLAWLAARVEGEYGTWDAKRLDQLVDLAYGFEPRAGPRADAFVDHVRLTKVEDPSANQVKVMTVHMAKGLEFGCVILPELDVDLLLRDPEFFTVRPEPSGPLESVSARRSEAVCRLDRRLAEMRSWQRRRELREALSLLYVAMTRPRYRLEMIVQPSPRRRRSFAAVLRSALAPGRSGRELWRHPDSAHPWWPASERGIAAKPDVPPRPAASELRFVASPEPRTLPARSPSGEEGGRRLDARDLLRSPTSTARLRGTLIHRFLQEVEWIDTLPADGELLAAAASLVPDPAAARACLAELRDALGRPNLRALLTRPPDEAAVWRERRFSVVLDGELWSGAFDRVVLRRDRAELVDFKTDPVRRSELGERVGFYRDQMDAYRRVLARMSGLSEDAIEAKLAFVSLDEVVPV